MAKVKWRRHNEGVIKADRRATELRENGIMTERCFCRLAGRSSNGAGRGGA